jgi:muramoyltetrapeptide carboxypeptidase
MHTIQSWSINSSFSFYKALLFFFCFTIIQQSSPNTHDSTRQFTKEIPFASLATARKNIDDNLRPHRFITQLGTEVIIGNTID